MKDQQPQKNTAARIDQLDIFQKVIEKTHDLLIRESDVNEDEIHSVKSILYAAIEKVKIKADHLAHIQKMLREIFIIVNARADLKNDEKVDDSRHQQSGC